MFSSAGIDFSVTEIELDDTILSGKDVGLLV